jgi:hypothetical protein
MGGACSMHGRMRNVYKIWGGKSEGMRPLRTPRHRWEDTIKMDIKKIGWSAWFLPNYIALTITIFSETMTLVQMSE